MEGEISHRGEGPAGTLEFLTLLGDSARYFVRIVDAFLLFDNEYFHDWAGWFDLKNLLSHIVECG